MRFLLFVSFFAASAFADTNDQLMGTWRFVRHECVSGKQPKKANIDATPRDLNFQENTITGTSYLLVDGKMCGSTIQFSYRVSGNKLYRDYIGQLTNACGANENPPYPIPAPEREFEIKTSADGSGLTLRLISLKGGGAETFCGAADPDIDVYERADLVANRN